MAWWDGDGLRVWGCTCRPLFTVCTVNGIVGSVFYKRWRRLRLLEAHISGRKTFSHINLRSKDSFGTSH